MSDYQKKVEDFLNSRNIAFAGVSRKADKNVANAIMRKFSESGYKVFPVNPHASEIDGFTCYENIQSIPEQIDAVLITTKPIHAIKIVKDCKEASVKMVWFHRSLGQGSFSQEAADFCSENNITAIENGCPIMFLEPVDIFHKWFKHFLNFFGKLEK
ncbi:MAG: CoA-binding protein [Ignavibacteria bacterium]|jgi:predicted CoA-binding protein